MKNQNRWSIFEPLANLSMKDAKLIHPIDNSNGKVYEELSKKTDSK